MKSRSRIKQSGEVFTPASLIHEMLDKLPPEIWFNPNLTWLEPAAGDGNFLVEIKARLLQAGHDEKHILDNMLFSIELIDDNHWVLQHRLGYLVDGLPNPKFWSGEEEIEKWFKISEAHPQGLALNNYNPYADKLGLEKNQVLHHINHVCYSALEYDMSFSRAEQPTSNLPLLPVKELGEWPKTDTPEIGDKSVVEKTFNRKITDTVEITEVLEKPPKLPKLKVEKVKVEKVKVEKTISFTNDDLINIIKPFNPIIKGKKFIEVNGKLLVWCGERLSANKKWGDNALLVVQYGNDLLTIKQKDYLESGPIKTNTWINTGGYIGGKPNPKLLSQMKPLNEILKEI